jgi:hypothetical protein
MNDDQAELMSGNELIDDGPLPEWGLEWMGAEGLPAGGEVGVGGPVEEAFGAKAVADFGREGFSGFTPDIQAHWSQ